jgi:hypothetical protein
MLGLVLSPRRRRPGKEAKNRVNIPLQEKSHRGILRGLRYISETPKKILLGRAKFDIYRLLTPGPPAATGPRWGDSRSHARRVRLTGAPGGLVAVLVS